jgi:hypothetical protein
MSRFSHRTVDPLPYTSQKITHHNPPYIQYRYNPRARLVVEKLKSNETMIKIFLLLIVLVIAGLAGFSWLTLHWSYSTGERAGFVQKLSKKGYVCKTWEGEMAMVTMPGTVAEKFRFTVQSDTVAAQLNTSMGKRVAVHYEEHRWLPSSCFGETDYFVTAVQVTE